MYSSEPEVGFLAGLGVVAIVLAILVIIISVALLALIIVANCKLFKKAGEEWWKAIIPVYNSWIETKICGLKWYWFLIFYGFTMLISFQINSINYAIYMGLCLTSFNYNYNLAKKFGKSNGFAVLTTLLPIIGLPILAFGSAQYDKDAKTDPNGVFSTKNW